MKEFLVKLCKENERPNTNPLSIYSQIKAIPGNNTFRFINPSELRLDINISKVNEDNGRYTYLVGSGWTKTNKEDLHPDFDLMMAGKTFRLGIKKEDVEEVDASKILEILNSEVVQKQGVFVRLKKALRVSKNN